jgi:toxin CptA
MKSAPAIVFDVSPSRWIAAAACLLALAGVIALVFSGLALWGKFLAAALACIYTGYELRAFLRNPVRRAAWYEAGHWRIADAQGAEHLAELQQGIARGPWIVLRLRRSDGARIAIILGPDNSDIDTRRRLRVRLGRGHADVT